MKNNSVERFQMIVRCFNEIILFSDEATDEDIEVILTKL